MSAKIAAADELIKTLNLSAHVEGGYYSQVYKSTGCCMVDGVRRATATSIYFLLKSGQISRMHSLKSDELWYFHLGSPLKMTMISQEGALSEQILGSDVQAGQRPQLFVPAGNVFGAEMLGGEGEFASTTTTIDLCKHASEERFALVSCMVTPGFEYEDLTIESAADLKEKFPQHAAVIERLSTLTFLTKTT